MTSEIRTREIYLARHHIKTVRYGIPIWNAIPDSEKQGLPKDAMARVMFGLYVHDISKIVQLGWTDELLFSNRHPTTKEWAEVIVPHPDRAKEILLAAGIHDETVLDAASYHHVREDDKWFQGVTPDGSTVPKYAGYPMGVIGAMLPIHKKMGKCPDAISSMEEDRPYREIHHTPDSILAEVTDSKRAGKEYTQVIVDAFASLPKDEREGIYNYHINSEECARNIETRLRILQAAACELGYLKKDAENASGLRPTSRMAPEDTQRMLNDFADFYGIK